MVIFIKNGVHMKKTALSLLCIFTLTAFTLAQAAESKQENKISAQGKAMTEQKADVAYIIFYVKTDGLLTVDALKQLDEKTITVTDAVKKAGKDKIRDIKKELIKLGDKENFNNMSDKSTPQAINQLTLTIEPSVEFAAEIMDVIMRSGGSLKMMNNYFSGDNIANSSVVFGIEKSEELEKELTNQALADAKANAQKMATLIGRKVGDPIMVNYNMNWNNNPNQKKFKAKYISANYEKIKADISLTVTFQLLDN